MSIVFYSGSGSPFAWRVQLALEHKQLAYELTMLSFSAGDTRKPEFVALNPRHRVPVIVDDDFVLYESAVILEYLDERYPEFELFPGDAQQRARIRRIAREAELYLGLDGMERLVEQLFFTEAADRLQPVIDAAIAVCHQELAFFEQRMSDDFLAGPALTAADFTLYPLIGLLLRMESRFPEVAMRGHIGPKLAAWQRRIEALPYFGKTWPPHWV